MASRVPRRVGKDRVEITSDFDHDYQYKVGEEVNSKGIKKTFKNRRGRKKVPVVQRLMEHSELVRHKDFYTSCFLYGGIEHTDYASIWYHGKYVRVHRMALILDGQILTEGMHIDHLCERKNCWNISHLEEVTPSENKNRYHISNGNSKLIGGDSNSLRLTS